MGTNIQGSEIDTNRGGKSEWKEARRERRKGEGRVQRPTARAAQAAFYLIFEKQYAST